MTIKVEKSKETEYIELICVEDGSIDITKLEDAGIPESNIILYRKGSKPPYLLRVKKIDE